MRSFNRLSFTNILFKSKYNNFSIYNKENFLLNIMNLNIYGGADIDLDKINEKLDLNPEDNYDQMIKSTLNEFKQKNVQSITVTIPTKFSFLIHYFISNQFYFHHTKKDKLILCKWLNEFKANSLPNYCHHSVGIGAIIINKNFEFLLVKEKYTSTQWKFVTGHVETGESIKSTTLREAKEEVGLDVKFIGNYIFRDIFPTKNNINDICFFNLCYFEGENNDIKICQNEIKEATFLTIKNCQVLCKANQATELTKIAFRKIVNDVNHYTKTHPEKFYEKDSINSFIQFMTENKLLKHVEHQGKNNSSFDFWDYYAK